jgi:hypothetical protein
MANEKFDTFISYRRVGGDTVALLLKAKLEEKRRRVFLDVTSLRSGRFDESLLRAIETAPNFLIILSPNSLNRCSEKEDWLRKELAHAMRTSRNIVPVLMPGFIFPEDLPPDIKEITAFHGIDYSHDYSESTIKRIAQLLTPVRKPWLALSFVGAVVLFLALIILVPLHPKAHQNPRSLHTEESEAYGQKKAEAPKLPKANSIKGTPTSLVKISHDSNLEAAQWYLDGKKLPQRQDSTMLFSYFHIPFGRHSLKVVAPESTCEFDLEISTPEQEERVRCPE